MAKPEPLFAEYHCVSCKTPFISPFPLDEDGRCALCRLGASGFDDAYSFGFYQDELRQLVQLFKYSKIQTLAAPLGRLLALALPRGLRFDVIVPMPMHWRKRWQRGFNQAELLAREIARRTNLPVRNAVKRVHQKSVQAGLTNAKRRANVAGAFRPRRGKTLEGKRVLLIDDVMTTGATASACAKALKRAGAARVTLLTVARVDRRIVSVDYKVSDVAGRSRPDAAFAESTFPRSLDAKSGSFA